MSNGKGQAGYQGPPDFRSINGHPMTGDTLLKELIYEIRALRAEFAEWSTPPDFVMLAENGEIAPELLHSDFPGYKALSEAGVTSWGDLEPLLTIDDLNAINGIGPKTAEEILTAATERG